MKKRMSAWILTLVLALSLTVVPAGAVESDFKIENGVLTKYNGFGGAVTIPSSVTSIGEGAFAGCTSLTSITMPSSVTSIGNAAFTSCTSLASITIPSSVTSIGEQAFYGCTGLTSVTIPSSVTSTGVSAFYGCTGLTSVTIPSSVTSIGKGAFAGCTGLTGITIPSSVTSIGEEAFYGCTGLTSVTFPDSVTSIGVYAFSQCSGLTSITFPSSVTSIRGSTFSGCTSLTDVYYGGSEAQWKSIDIGVDNDPVTGATIHYNSAPSQQPSNLAYPSTQNVLVDGQSVEFPCYALKDENGNDTNYIKLRDVAQILNGTAAQFAVTWDGAVNIVTGQPYTANGTEMNTPFAGSRIYTVPASETRVNGAAADLDAIVLTDDAGNGYTYYKLRDLGTALGFTVDWSAEKGIFIETDKP